MFDGTVYDFFHSSSCPYSETSYTKNIPRQKKLLENLSFGGTKYIYIYVYIYTYIYVYIYLYMLIWKVVGHFIVRTCSFEKFVSVRRIRSLECWTNTTFYYLSIFHFARLMYFLQRILNRRWRRLGKKNKKLLQISITKALSTRECNNVCRKFIQ